MVSSATVSNGLLTMFFHLPYPCEKGSVPAGRAYIRLSLASLQLCTSFLMPLGERSESFTGLQCRPFCPTHFLWCSSPGPLCFRQPGSQFFQHGRVPAPTGPLHLLCLLSEKHHPLLLLCLPHASDLSPDSRPRKNLLCSLPHTVKSLACAGLAEWAQISASWLLPCLTLSKLFSLSKTQFLLS